MKLAAEASNQGILQRWFPGWGQQPHPQPSDTEEGGNDDTDTISLSEEDELMNELGYETEDTVFVRDRIFLTLSFTLSGGSLKLLTTPTPPTISFFGPEPLLELGFSSLCCSVDLRPRLRYAMLDLSLGSLSVQDHTDPESLFPVLVNPKGGEVCVGVVWVCVSMRGCVCVVCVSSEYCPYYSDIVLLNRLLIVTSHLLVVCCLSR